MIKRFISLIFFSAILIQGFAPYSFSDRTKRDIQQQTLLPGSSYDTGSPNLRDIWVDAVNGNDSNNGNSPATALRTLTAAWDSLPMNTTLTEGVRINLQPGTYPASMVPVYWEGRHGTFTAPIWIRGNGSSRSQVVLQASLNIYNSSYLYFENLSIIFNGDAFHCELCDHFLLRNLVLDGSGAAQETIKVNQSQYLYVENNDISGAYENVIDYVAVQYGHIIGNQIHDAGDWCAYAKGGSAYLLVERNTIYDCLTGGFTAGQGTGFQYMTSPWIQYETYDIKVINNIIHDTQGAGLGVNGGYNILLAYNTLYRVGSQSHVIEVVYGLRSCDGNPGDPGRERCQQYLDQGGWGTTAIDDGTNAINIPDRNIYIYNNIVYNPSGFQSAWQHFAIYDSRTNPPSSNIANPTTDVNLHIHGNVIWNGSSTMPLGIEGNSDACIPSDTNCNETQLRADNAINTIEPIFVDAAGGDFHLAGNWLSSVTLFDIPNYIWELGIPQGTLNNTVTTDYAGTSRVGQNAPGAYANAVQTFADVPSSYWAASFIEQLYDAGITGGCSSNPLNYCPESTVTRAQMAVFLLKGIHNSSFTPPAVGESTGFGDVAPDYWAAAWIKQLAAESITGGCGGGNYCPDDAVTRAQMAVFLLKAKHGASYIP
ncbi:MAG TPA: S-layer homology domain-containing protein, partial [Anaerolineales bacterium]|nr:S-layer homology domain-containing protein [Anaerolineales bacterium]